MEGVSCDPQLSSADILIIPSFCFEWEATDVFSICNLWFLFFLSFGLGCWCIYLDQFTLVYFLVWLELVIKGNFMRLNHLAIDEDSVMRAPLI